MIIMSVDLGKARTGLAVSDPSGTFAFPKEVITEYHTDRLIEKVCDRAKNFGAERIVVGYPKNMDGTLGPRAEKAEAFKAVLEETFHLPVTLWDERRTTIDAHRILFESGQNAKKRKKTVDAVAAALILEGYLTFKKSRG